MSKHKEVESPSKEVKEAKEFAKKTRKKAKRYNRLDKKGRPCRSRECRR